MSLRAKSMTFEVPETPRAHPTDPYGIRIAEDEMRAYMLHMRFNASEEAIAKLKYALVAQGCLDAKDSTYSKMLHGGVPRSYRRNEWLVSTGVAARLGRESATYCRVLEEWVKNPKLLDEKNTDQIQKDAPRAGRSLFVDSKAQAERVERILSVYCLTVPEEGYSQGQNFFVSAMILLGMDDDEIFAMLGHICQTMFPCTFTESHFGLEADLALLMYYMEFKCKPFIALANRYNIMTEHFPRNVLMSLGLYVIPHASCFCVWDRMFAYGVMEFFLCVMRIFNAVAIRVQSEIDIRSLRHPVREDFVMGAISAKLKTMTDIGSVLNSELPHPSKKISPAAFNRRRQELRLKLSGVGLFTSRRLRGTAQDTDARFGGSSTSESPPED